MILTLTPNPSFDRTVALDGELARGQVHRVISVTSQAGGKGVNISRAAVSADIPSIAVVPALKDDPFVLELLGAGIDCRPVRPAGDVRVNLTITEPDGTTTKLNAPGAEVTREDLERMAAVADLTPFQLIGAFNRTIGLTPHAYLTQLRIRAAIHHLAAGRPLTDAAVASGFYDQSALTRHFKRTFGMTPLQYVRARKG